MSKVKITSRIIEEYESDLEYPIYLYFQDELCNDELIKVEENYFLRIKYSAFGVEITQGNKFIIEEHYLKNSLTTESHFNEIASELLSTLIESI